MFPCFTRFFVFQLKQNVTETNTCGIILAWRVKTGRLFAFMQHFLKMKWVIMFKLKSAVLPASKEAESPDGLFYSILLYCQCFSHFFLFFCCLTTLFVPIGTVYFIDVQEMGGKIFKNRYTTLIWRLFKQCILQEKTKQSYSLKFSKRSLKYTSNLGGNWRYQL